MPLFILMIICGSAVSASAAVTITSPQNGATVGSPVHCVAYATSGHPIQTLKIYVDYKSVYTVASNSLNTYLTLAAGSHRFVVQAWDTSGNVFKKVEIITVSSSSTPTPPVAVSISPSTAVLQASNSQQFTASVSGTTNTTVTWEVNGIPGGSSTTGTISSSGLYTAPSVTSNLAVTVTARSTYDTALTARSSVTVTPPNAGSNYYVAPSGSDTNTGTSASPWQTIQHAIDLAKVDPTYGTTIHVAGGTYPASVSAGSLTPACPSNSVAFCVNKSGISNSARLVIQCDAPNFGCRVTGGSTAMAEFANSGYADIIGFEYGNLPSAMSAIIGYTGTSNRIINNYFHDVAQSYAGGCPQEGMIVASGSVYGLVVRGNIVRHYGDNTLTSCQTSQGIYVSNGAIIENNIVSDTPGLGIQFGPSMCNGVVSNNTVFANRGGGILIDDAPGSSCTVNGNMTVNNNIVVNNGDGWGYYGISDSYRTQAPIYNSYRNNILYGNYPNDNVRATAGGGTISGI